MVAVPGVSAEVRNTLAVPFSIASVVVAPVLILSSPRGLASRLLVSFFSAGSSLSVSF